MRKILITMIMFSAISFPAFAEDAPVVAEPAPVQDNTPPPPVEAAPIVVTPPVEKPPEITAEIPAETPKEEVKPQILPDRRPDNRKDNDSKKPDDRKHYNHDAKKDDWKKDRDHSYRPRVVYRRAPPKIVYVYPQSYYPTNSYYESYTTYPNGYTASYHVGGYLPPEREWRPLPDYVRYGLPAPRRGELWVYNDRDAVLINDETSRIISGFVLAAPVD